MALEAEKAKSATLAVRVAELEEQLRARDRESPRRAAASSLARQQPTLSKKKSVALQRTGLRKTSQTLSDMTPSTEVFEESRETEQEDEEKGEEEDKQIIGEKEGEGSGGVVEEERFVKYPEAILVLRLLERSDVQRLGLTCCAWYCHAKQYLGEWRRTRLVLELGDTERTFVQNMRGIVERYILPRTVGTKFLDDEEAFELFANTEELYRLNRDMYKEIRSVLGTWGGESCISSVFEAFESAPELYRVYSSNQTNALAFAEQLRFELRIADNDWRLLESFLIQPIQRIPRYQMLLREVAHNTRQGHAEHESIAKAQTLLTRVGREMEKGMEEAANAKVGKDMLSGPIADVPAWLHAGPGMRCELYAEAKRSEGMRKTAKATDCFIMAIGNFVVLADVAKTVSKKTTAVGASVAAPLGKGCAALDKSWRFSKHFSRDVLKVAPVSETVIAFSAADSDSTQITFESAAEANKWLALLRSHK